ncbi:MAG TPA: ABC transporter substrate-binding protein [Planctomycetota bacterium]|nr:ABC transporter substrate-binding protein [Planctomycetota bacterium]
MTKLPYIVFALFVFIFIAALLFDQPPRLPTTPDTVQITYWEKWTGFEGEAMKATVDFFNRKKFRNKNGQVIQCRYLATTQVNRKSLMAIAGGHPPDVAGFWARETHIFADMNALMDLNQFIDNDQEFDKTKYLDSFWRYCVYKRVADKEAKIWCLPTTPATVALHWNKEMFKEAGLEPERPPQTLEELEEFAAKLTRRDKDGRLVRMGFLPPEPGWWNWAWGYYFGGKLNDGLEKITADDPKNIAAWKWLLKFNGRDQREAEELIAFKQAFGSFDSPQNAFLSGKVGMVLQGVWMANFIRFHNPHLKWGCAPFPTSFDNGGEPVTVADMDVITIPRGCRHPEEAWQLLKFINSNEGMEYLCGREENNNGGQGKLTPFKDVDAKWLAQHRHPYLQVFIDLAKSKNAVTIPQLPVWEEYQKELSSAFERVWLRKATPEEALGYVQRRMQPKLERALQQLRASEAEARR